MYIYLIIFSKVLNVKGKIIKGSTAKVKGGYYEHHCNRCENYWYVTNESPKNCASPKCKSPYWNRERIRDNVKVNHIKQKKKVG